MFDRMYKEIQQVADLVDIEHTPEQFLTYFSETLNHPKFYSEKIGYAEQPPGEDFESFLDYSIFDRIERGIATEDEVQKFRQFIIDTSALFKQKGSAQSIEAFFRLYDFITDVKEMWTSNFSTTVPDPLIDYFILDPTLKNTRNNFAFKGINVSGWDNGKAQYISKVSDILIDNYHYVTRHSYPTDIVDGLSDDCISTFLINDYSPNVLNIQRDDGRSIAQDDKAGCGTFDAALLCTTPADLSCTLEGFDIQINSEFTTDKEFNFGSLYKIWQAPQNYVSRVNNVLGLIPKGNRERDENPIDNSDDFLWANWNSGVTIPNEIVGVSQNSVRNPVFDGVLPNFNYSSTSTEPNLISGIGVETKGDNFIVARGFVQIRETGYYIFSLDVGNTGSISQVENQHSGLFSLSKTPLPNIDAVKSSNVDSFEFDRIPGSTQFSVLDNGFNLSLNSRNTEYGLIEVRQNESENNSEYVLMTPGFYPYEIKATYGNVNIKKLKLSLEGWRSQTNTSNNLTRFFNFLPKQIIATNDLTTVDNKELTIEDSLGAGLLTIPNQSIEAGEIFKISYSTPDPDRDNISGIISTGDEYKDLEFNVRFKPDLQQLADEEVLPFQPRNSFQIIFRAVNRQKDLYANVDSYYALLYDGRKSEVSLAYVTYDKNLDDVSYRYLNFNENQSDLDQREFFIPLLDSDGLTKNLEQDKWYDFKLIVKDDKATLYYRQNDKFTDAREKVRNTEEQRLLEYKDDDEFQLVFNSVPLEQGDEQTIVYDRNGRLIEVADRYIPILDAGHYGFAIQASSILINRIVVCPLDNVDENLLEDVDKWKQIKPKWLDFRNDKTLQYNSYGITNVEKPTAQTFRTRFSDGFDGTARYPLAESLENVTDNSVDRVFVDNINVNEWGTRFNILMDRDFVENRFETREDALNRLIVPFGQFFEPSVNWFRVGSDYNYGPAGYNPIIYENARILPHTIAASANQVLEYTSYLSRDEDEKENLYLQTKLNTHIKANSKDVEFNGIWEEVCPSSVSEKWQITDCDTVDNEVFAPIYRDTTVVGTSGQEIIGVRIVDEDAHERLTCRYCKNATLWGLFDITYPDGVNDNYPLFNSSSVQIDGTFRYFVPIGRLEEGKYIHVIAPEILRGEGMINMIGVYAHHDYEGFTFIDNDDTVQIRIDEPVHWEAKYSQNITSEYYLDVNTKFVGKFTETNIIPLQIHAPSPCEPGEYPEAIDDYNSNCLVDNIPNAFYMPENIVNIFDRLERVEYPDETDTVQTEQFSQEFNWWNPKQVWVERDIDPRYPSNNGSNVYSGLGNSTTQGTPVSLVGSDRDGYPSSYLVDVDWCVSSVGWDHTLAISGNNDYGFGTFTDEEYASIGFDPSETRFTLDSEEIITISEHMRAPIPLDTVQTADITSGNSNVLTFGDIVNGDGNPNRTFIPVGLYNWYLVHANNEDFLNNETSRIGWDLTEWNEEFVDCFNLNKAYYPVETEKYSINKYWAFYPNYSLPFGSIVRVEINQTRVAENCDPERAPQVPPKLVTLGVSDGLVMFYDVPPLVDQYPKWRRLINRVIVNNYTLPNDYYYISVNTENQNATVVLNTQQFDFERFVGDSRLFIELFFDRLFDITDRTELVDDFLRNRDINWIPCVSDERKYKIATRQPDLELKFTGDSLPYSIISYKNSQALKMEDKFADVNLSGFSGTDDSIGSVGIFGNEGSRSPIYLTDIESSNYTFECDVIFDKDIINTQFSKQFELILKAENNYVPQDKEWGITDYYFVGFGTYNFDVGLGMRSLGSNGEIKETYLASWGEFNTRSIRPDVWYTLGAQVTTNSIKIFFNERGKDPQLILSYNTNKKYEKLSERYLRGEWETLQSILVGLEELQVTYPNKLGNIVSSEYTFNNFKEEFASTLPVDGFFVGFRMFNPMTYVGEVRYDINKPRVYTYSTTLDGRSLNNYLVEIENNFGLPNDSEINKYDKSKDFVEYLLLNDTLYYKIEGKIPEKYPNPVDTFYIVEDRVFVIEKEYASNTGVGINYWDEGRHIIVWSIEKGSDPYGIVRAEDFFRIIPNLVRVNIIRNRRSNVTQLDDDGNIVGSRIALKVGDIVSFQISCSDLALNTFKIIELDEQLTLNELDKLPIEPPEDCKSIWALSGKIARFDIKPRVFDTRFFEEFPILIKDKTFYKDSIMKYEEFTEKKVKEVHINDNKFNIIFEDIE
jgi:hypothetical protein